MAPQDDLTAERAAKLYSLLHATIPHDGIFGPDDIKAIRKMEIVDKALIIAALQAARQEALREARQAVLAEMLEDPPDNIGDAGYNTAIRHAADALDRLASEG